MRKRFKGLPIAILICLSILLCMRGGLFGAVSRGGAVFGMDSFRSVPTGVILSQMLSYEPDCPVGTVYTSLSGEGEAGYFTPSLCIALYGDGAVPKEWESVEEFSIFLTATEHPVELAVFRSLSSADAEEVAELCARRLSVLRRFRRGTEYELYTARAQIAVFGRYVVMAVSADPEVAVEEARRVIRG